MSSSKRFWFVRAGSGCVYLDDFLEESVVAVSWREMPRFDPGISKDELTRLARATYPGASKHKLAAAVGQLLRFLQAVEVGDHVATYDADQRLYVIGVVKSAASYWPEHEELTWRRDVEWSRHVSRDVLSTGTRNSLGAISTIFQPSEDAARELLEKSVGLDEDPASAGTPEPDESDADETAALEEDVIKRADEFIEDRVNALDWEEMQELVAGVLRAMGYQTEVAAPGPDRGVDIFASPDGLGLEEPRIFVEVKHRRGSMGGPSIRSFIGGRQQGDRCLYVSTGGFTKDARYEADRANIPVKLVSLPRLRELLVQHYDDLEPEIQALVPLRRLYWPAD